MSDQSIRQRMQEALDGTLSDDKVEELFSHLDEEPQAAAEFDRLQRLDGLLRRAPHERPPERLAATIMARLADQLEAEAAFQQLPEATQQTLMLSLSLVVMTMMPMMVAASWLVLNAQSSPELLNEVMQRSIALLYIMVEALQGLLDEIEQMATEDPEVAAVAVTLIPYVLIEVLEYMETVDQQWAS